MTILHRTQGAGFVAALVMVAAWIPVSGCVPVTLISDYDEVTDHSLADLQEFTDDFITGLLEQAPSDDNAFEAHTEFYEDADRRLRRIEFRTSSIPKNSQTVRLVQRIREMILGDGSCTSDGPGLRDLHCMPENAARGPSSTSLVISRRNINQAIRAALSLELAKKQGLERNR